MPKKYKLVVNTPLSHADQVRMALGDAGAGHVGNYTHCSFSVRGIGRFIPQDGATPHIGQVGKSETVDEEQIQVNVDENDLEAVLSALRAAHPYEEIGYDLYELLNLNN